MNLHCFYCICRRYLERVSESTACRRVVPAKHNADCDMLWRVQTVLLTLMICSATDRTTGKKVRVLLVIAGHGGRETGQAAAGHKSALGAQDAEGYGNADEPEMTSRLE